MVISRVRVARVAVLDRIDRHRHIDRDDRHRCDRGRRGHDRRIIIRCMGQRRRHDWRACASGKSSEQQYHACHDGK